ncbi:hypothetical protein BGZ61DRAFT_464614, partial [Ilyonectria robusta]|uniref:uncharacterized protein n=1 Tax=Ilyonectria robusta TaxID=1079257 RepID=UPI001E8D3671
GRRTSAGGSWKLEAGRGGQVGGSLALTCFTSGLLHVLRRGRGFKWSALGGWMKRLGQ